MSEVMPPQVRWAQLSRAIAPEALFALRTVLAMLLALLIAFRLDLSSPGSAAVTVSIIALPQAGMVLEKSFYRFAGTLAGALLTLTLVGVFAQHRDTFIFFVALWIGLCTMAAGLLRGFKAYGWALAGYTTCLIGFPAFQDAAHAFDIAVDRVSIVSVGILSAGIVNAVLFPTRSTDVLVKTVRTIFAHFVHYADRATQPGDAAQIYQRHHQFYRDLASLEVARSSSYFENASARIRNQRLLSFSEAFLLASSRLHLLHRQLDSLPASDFAAIAGPMEGAAAQFRQALRVAASIPRSAAEAQPVRAQLTELLARWPQVSQQAMATAAGAQPAPAAVAALANGLFMLEEAAKSSAELAASYADLHPGGGRQRDVLSRPPFVHADPLYAALSGLWAMTVVISFSAFWIVTAWPSGFVLVLLGAVSCALFAAAPQPARAASLMSKGFLVAFPLVILCYSLVLPWATSFGALSLGLLPFLAVGSFVMGRPRTALWGSGYLLMFLTALNLTSPMRYDFIDMVNNSIAEVMGLLAAALGLTLLSPSDAAWRGRRVYRRLLHSLKLAQSGPLVGLQYDFEHRVRDLALQLTAFPTLPPVRAQSMALVVLAAGDGLIRWRTLARRFEPTSDWKIDYAVGAIAQMLAEDDARSIGQPLARLQQSYRHWVDSQNGQPQRLLALAPQLTALRTLILAVEEFVELNYARDAETPHAA